MPDADAGSTPELSELPSRDAEHLHSPFSPLPTISPSPDGSLPYLDLGGPGFERLVFLLLLADGHTARYFGRSGQAQFGIDLVVPVGETQHVYQCKNTADFPPAAMREALGKFEREWLGRDDVPRPSCFVLCCSADLRRHEEAWSVEAEAFRRRTGVVATLWERSTFDERLRRLPDLVADLFSDALAERFCEHEAWTWDLLRPLEPGSGSEPIERFLRLQGDGVLDVPETLRERFDAILRRETCILLRGAPGSGKTMTGLALASGFGGGAAGPQARATSGRWRIYHLDLAHDWRESEVVRAVRQRLSRPTIFVLDDAHHCADRLPSLHRRLDALLADQPTARRVYLLRHTPAPAQLLRDASELEQQLDARDAVLDLAPDLGSVRRLALRLKPAWPPLRAEQVERLATICAYDLTLLTQILDTVESPEALQELDLETLYPDLLRRFCGPLPVDLPALRAVACLGQFEIHPPLAYRRAELDAELPRLPTDLVTTAGRPPRRVFFHPSGAELVFRALCWQDGEAWQDGESWLAQEKVSTPAVARMREILCDYFAGQTSPWNDLVQVLDGDLRLASRDELLELRRALLCAPALVQKLRAARAAPLPLRLLGHALLAAPEVYASSLSDACQPVAADDTGSRVDLLQRFAQAAAWELPFVLRALVDTHGEAVTALRARLRATLAETARQTSLPHLEYLLAYLGEDEPDWLQAVTALPDEAVESLVDATLRRERAASQVVHNLGALHQRAPRLAKALEQRLGGEVFLRLLRHDGTIVELLKLVQHASFTLGAQVLAAASADDLETLLTATVTQRRSIGTLDLTLRALSADRRNAVEMALPPYLWWHLLGHLGDLAILAGILRRLSRRYRADLLRAARDPGTRSQERMHRVRTSLLHRSTLPQLGHFLRRHSFAVPSLFPDESAHTMDATAVEVDPVRAQLADLLARCDWQTLRYGHHLISGAPPTPFRDLCLRTLHEHVASVDLTQLAKGELRQPNLAEAMSFLRLLQGVQPDRLPAVLPHLGHLLPPAETWLHGHTAAPEEGHTLRLLRGLFHLLADEHAPAALARTALELGTGSRAASLCRQVDALEVLLYLWNALSLACAREPETSLEEIAKHFDPELRQVVTDRLSQLPETADAWDQALALTGFASFLGWDLEAARPRGSDDQVSLPQAERVESKGLVTGGFYLLGLHWLSWHWRDAAVEARHWQSVRTKVDEFDQTHRALDLLLARLREAETQSQTPS